MPMDKIVELEQRLKEYQQHSRNAEQKALEILRTYPKRGESLSPVEVLRRELLRHHTRILLLDEIMGWIEELKGIRLYQLYSEDEEGRSIRHTVRQYMTEKEAVEVNATYEANNEHLRWKPIDLFEEEEEEEEEGL